MVTRRRPFSIGLGVLILPVLTVVLVRIGDADKREAAGPKVRGMPGSPTATKSLDSKELPTPTPPFAGTIEMSADQSKPAWPPTIVPPKGAPNVLLIMTDDVGFGAPSTFGGTIPTPALDRIASMGLRYTMFHSTALCSPTRAALITGRNHHSAHTGVVVEQASGYPGYDSIIPKEEATIGEILKENGYATAWFGKEHNTPTWESTPAGPFDRWPVGLGFDYFYGFMGGDTSQWQPNLFRNTTPIEPYLGNPRWNLTTAMADDAIRYLKKQHDINPKKPFFIYYVPGGTHAPHHPTPEWIARFRGKFDHGWNVQRERIFAYQKRLGVIPANATLPPWPDSLPRWETLTPEEKKLFARQAEVYAAYLAYTDSEIGRVIQAVDDIGQLDNTLIFYISGDNGASPEGNVDGTPNEVAALNGVTLPVSIQMKSYDAWGTEQTYPHYSVGWAWAFDTPYRWTKQIASHFGGTRQGMAVAWRGHIKDAGGIRWQFHHVVDIVPTILEACRIPTPDHVNGIAQKPMEGVSMAYNWDASNARAPSRHHTQYFEMFGNRAIYHDGWIASTTPPNPPWKLGAPMPKDVVNGYKWELYNVSEDPTQNQDQSAQRPDKLREMQQLFVAEAMKYNVFPLNNQILSVFHSKRPGPTAGRSDFTYVGEVSNIPWGGAPSLLNRSYTITADVVIPPGGAEGMLVTQGGRFAGYGFYLLKGKPVFTWNLLDLARARWEGDAPLSPGRHRLVYDFKYDGGGVGKGGTGVLKVDGRIVASRRMEKTIPLILQFDEAFNTGVDTGTPVDDRDYQVPFRFTGELARLTVHLEPPPLSREEQERLRVKGQENREAE
jgi:arylsulfatase